MSEEWFREEEGEGEGEGEGEEWYWGEFVEEGGDHQRLQAQMRGEKGEG